MRGGLTMRGGLPAMAVLLGLAGGCGQPLQVQVGEQDGSHGRDHVGGEADAGDGAQEAGDSGGADACGDADTFQGLLDVGLQDQRADESLDVRGREADAAMPLLCEGNEDGKITADEIPMDKAMGLVATFTQNKPGTTVLVAGMAGKLDMSAMEWVWDFASKLPEDEAVYESVLPPGSFWFGDRFPEAQLVQPFSGDYLGLYRLEEAGLMLLGIASAKEQWTALAYAEPIPVLALPLENGDGWNAQQVEAKGLYEGEEYPHDYGSAGTLSVKHSFYFVADKQGKIKVPAGTFKVQRVRLDLTMQVFNSLMPVPAADKRVKIVMFVAECAGLVARVRSVDGETEDDFEQATEYRRLGL